MGQSLVVTLQLHLTTVTGSLLTEISQIVSRMFSDKLFENAFLMFFFIIIFEKLWRRRRRRLLLLACQCMCGFVQLLGTTSAMQLWV